MYVELDAAARLRNLARTARALPYDQRSYHLFEHRDLAHEAGANPDALQAFDPTDEALDAVLARTAPPAERPAQLASFGGPDVTPPGSPRGQGGGWMYPQPAAPKPPSQSEILLRQEVTAPADVAKSRDRFAPGYDTVLKGDEPVSRDLPRFIRGWEGSRSTAYDDGLGNMTIGTGHLVSGRNTFVGGITPEQDAALLNRNIADAQALVRRRVKAPLNQYQFDALTSLAMNVPSVFTRLDKSNQPSALLSALNNSEPNYRKAAEAFPNYDSGLNHKTGKQERLNGLARRRMAEAYLFLTGNYVSDH
jgi:lysozyme